MGQKMDNELCWLDRTTMDVFVRFEQDFGL